MPTKTVSKPASKKQETREEKIERIRNDFQQLFESYGVGERSLRFILIKEKHRILRPKAKITREGVVFNLRYLENSDSPFLEDQEFADVPDETKHGLAGIFITPREIIVSPNNPCLQKYLLLHPFNEENGGIVFRLFMPEKIAKKSYEARALKYKAEKYIMESEEEKINLVGTVLTKDFSGTFRMDAIEIKQDKLLAIAERNPSEVVDAFESDEVKVKSLVYGAVSSGIITIDKKAGKVKWGNTNQTLMDFIPSKDAVNAISNFLSTQDGTEIKERLIKELGSDS